MPKRKILFAWSGGKDSAMALYELQKREDIEIVALLTTVTKEYDRISMHGVRRSLLEIQAGLIGIPLEYLFIDTHCSNEQYEAAMKALLEKHKANGVSAVAFGDIFLEDLRSYRNEKLALVGMEAIFPIWKRDTDDIAKTFIDLGFKSIVTCVDSHMLKGDFAGRTYDEQLILDLPPNVDVCFENGECHTFVYDGPIFRCPVEFIAGEVVKRDDRYYFCDLLPV